MAAKVTHPPNSEEGAAAARLGVLAASSNGVGFVQVADGVEMNQGMLWYQVFDFR